MSHASLQEFADVSNSSVSSSMKDDIFLHEMMERKGHETDNPLSSYEKVRTWQLSLIGFCKIRRNSYLWLSRESSAMASSRNVPLIAELIQAPILPGHLPRKQSDWLCDKRRRECVNRETAASAAIKPLRHWRHPRDILWQTRMLLNPLLFSLNPLLLTWISRKAALLLARF